ncbi:flagellar protein FliT [sulfur-oxidizing endosymbiont of Gigantopelta aegis]|uniref:flagellar protein FliT n=1 Tax=sulfur-oxidizing endosymbiont of Gigantopelta aegis TaxID=2794934 RepID=UPI0018DAF654|nr:flagellar protein FliT [sulfur-oxidizing endosymbiont of Gigantopelta aegis]
MQQSLELAQFLNISQSMLSAAEAGDWACLPEREVERKKVMQQYFSSESFNQAVSLQGGIEESDGISQVINQVLEINTQIETLAEQGKLAINLQLQGMKKKQSVHSAYLQNE